MSFLKKNIIALLDSVKFTIVLPFVKEIQTKLCLLRHASAELLIEIKGINFFQS